MMNLGTPNNQKNNNTEVKIKTNDKKIVIATYIVKNLHVAIYLSKIYSKIYTVEIISGDKTWII